MNVDQHDILSAASLIAMGFAHCTHSLRIQMLARLVGAAGPLALAVVADGAFARHVRNARCRDVPISSDGLTRVTRRQVYELARYVEQSNPDVIRALLHTVAQDRAALSAISASLADVALTRRSARSGSPAARTTRRRAGADG